MEISGPWGTVSERSGLVSPLCKQGLFYFWGGKKKKKDTSVPWDAKTHYKAGED